MTRRFTLESFDSAEPAPGQQSDGLSQEKWLEAFEKGYKDGWEDAERTLGQRQGHISDAFAQNLMDLSFTLNEARAAVRKDLSSLLRGVLNALLPQTLVHFLGPQILAELDALAADHASGSFEILVDPQQKAIVEKSLGSAGVMAVTVIGDPDQQSDTAMIRLGDVEQEVDLAAALQEIAGMIETYFDEHETGKERAHG